MIWIATLCLLALAAWLFLNALNERRWVEAHQDDQIVAADEGLVPAYSRLSRSAEPEGRYSINQSSGSISRMATRVKEKTAHLGTTIEQKTAVSTSNNATTSAGGRTLSEIGTSITGSDSIVGRVAEKLSNVSEKIPAEKIRPNLRKKDFSGQTSTGPIGSAINNINDKLERIQSKVDG